MDKDR